MLIDTIDPMKTAMIVVDMQNDFVASGAPIEVDESYNTLVSRRGWRHSGPGQPRSFPPTSWWS